MLQKSLNGKAQESEYTNSSTGVNSNDSNGTLVSEIGGKTEESEPMSRIKVNGDNIHIEDIYLYLELYHSLGQILFMNENLLREKIILDPNWLIEAMKCLITRRAIRDDSHSDRKMGELKTSDVPRLWNESKKEFVEHSEHLLMSMEKLDMICLPKAYDETGNDKTVDFYYVPSMVEEAGPESAKPLGYEEKIILFDFKENLLPPAVFYRLVCHSLTNWTVHNSNLFCDQVSLEIDKNNLLHLRRKGNTIEVSFFFRHNLDETIVFNTKRYISETLNRVLKSYISAKIDGSALTWYDITEDRGQINDSVRRATEKDQSTRKRNKYSKAYSHLDNTDELSEKQLMFIAWSIEEEFQDEIQRKLRSELPTQSTVSYRYEQFEVTEIILLLLRELKTYNKNRGFRTTVSTLTRYIDEKTIQVALQHQEKEDSTPPNLKKSLTHQTIDAVALMVGYKAFPVAIGLGLTINEIVLIRKDHVGDTLGFIQKLLRYWMSSKSKEATVEKLADVLIETNCSTDPLLED